MLSDVKRKKELFLIGYASGIAGADSRSEAGPLVMQQSPVMALLQKEFSVSWKELIKYDQKDNYPIVEIVAALSRQLANVVASLVTEKKCFVVLGGDHTSAIGTVNGLAKAVGQQPGLLWIDAHMDSHTPETTHSGNLHGMPLACLLGRGASTLTQLYDFSPVLNPKHVCLVGVRSFESEEAALLNELGVKVFYMDEIHARGLQTVLTEAKRIVTNSPAGYCITFDIDSIDPQDAPGTGVAEPDGLRAVELFHALKIFANDPLLKGIEIVEFDPHLDVDHKTENVIAQLILAILGSNK